MHRGTCRLGLLLAIPLIAMSGCFSPWFSWDADRSSFTARRDRIKDSLESEDRPTIIAQMGVPTMLTLAKVENIGLVTQLRGTGGKVNASAQRTKILDTMRRKDTDSPNAVLDDPSTAMIVASALVPPAARKGDLQDVAIHLSTHAEGTDIAHGWLLKTPLMEMNRLGGQVREGFQLLTTEGSVVTRQQMTGLDEPDAKLNGIIVGGGRLLKSRQLGISIDSDFADAVTMAAVVPAINRRFTYFDGRKQTGVAVPRGPSAIEITVPPAYQRDPFHFIKVVLQIGFNETAQQRSDRIETLKQKLLQPATVRTTCWQLEAIGEGSVEILANALDDPNPEVRFYAAHSLAYLNERRAIPVLVSLCFQEPAFRAMCLNGLIAIDSYEAADALRGLLDAADAETKYGAVLALRYRDASDPQVTGTNFGSTGSILDIPSTGPPLVAVSLSKVREVTIFGENPILHIPSFQYVNPHIIVAPSVDGLTVSHFRAGQNDQIVTTTSDLRAVLSAISEVGGVYGDWVSFVRECHENGYFIEPFAMNPIPIAGRTYDRKPDKAVEPGGEMYEETVSNIVDEDSLSTSESSVWYNPFSWSN